MPKTPIRSTDGVLLTDLAHRIAMAAGKRVPRESTVRALKRAGEV
jgi:hypothetical protein